jgi:excisionase family DNA binding protein
MSERPAPIPTLDAGAVQRAQARLRSTTAPVRRAPDAEDGLVAAAVAAELLDLPKSWVLAEARAGRIPHVRLGRYVRFEPDELRSWWREKRHGPGAPGPAP